MSSAPADVDITAIPVRHPGRWIGAGVVLAFLGFIVWAFAHSSIAWSVIPEFLFSAQLSVGAVNTVIISVLSMVVGLVLGVLSAVMRQSDNPVLAWVAKGYIWLFRGTPVLVQLLLWYNLSLVFPTIPLTNIQTNAIMTPFLAALLGLGINEGAYMAEIVRSGLASIDDGQLEAAAALGMSPALTLRRITLPQAMRVIIPPTGNEFINMLKTSSLAYSIQFYELLQSSTRIYTRTLAVIEMLLVASIWYLALTSIFSVIQYGVEKHYAKSDGARSLWATVSGNLTLGRKVS